MRPSRSRRLAATIAAALLACGCGQSQIGPDPDAFKAVDALYTAVSLRDPERVDHCLKTLAALQESGRMDREPLDALSAIATDARSGSWEPAQTQLARFMRSQTRGR